jgi:ATP-dependent Clp endopeptidase proteolytic subunit ClpP
MSEFTAGDPAEVSARITRALAEADKFTAEARKAEAEAMSQTMLRRSLESDARRSELLQREAEVTMSRLMASDKYHHVYRFSDEVDDRSVNQAISEFLIWDRTAPGCDMELIINSPGGSIIAGMEFFDFLQEMRRKGHHLITATRGYAASMGGILLQAGNERVAGAESYVLIHEAATMVGGKTSSIEDEAAFLKKVQTRILNIFEHRSREAFDNGTSDVILTADDIANGSPEKGVKGWLRRDWWLPSDEALRLGVVDSVR